MVRQYRRKGLLVDVPSLEEIIRAALESDRIGLHTAALAQVDSFDASAGTVDVTLVMRQPLRSTSGETVYAALPKLAGVRVGYPSGGGCSVAWPLAEGDHVQIVFQRLDHSRWLESGARVNDPDLVTMHGLFPWALPLASFEAPEVPTAGVLVKASEVALCADAANAKFVALAELVDARIQQIRDAIANAAPAGGDGGASFKAAIVQALDGVLPVGPPVTTSVAATVVKAE